MREVSYGRERQATGAGGEIEVRKVRKVSLLVGEVSYSRLQARKVN